MLGVDLETWIWVVVSFLTGSLTAAIVTVAWDCYKAKRVAEARQKAMIASLAGELRRSKAVCEHNAKLRRDLCPAFIRFPTSAAMSATFEERHSFPKLTGLHQDLEHYTMGVSHINQMIQLHDRLWASAEQPNATSPGARGWREQLRHQIADICSGQDKLEGVGPENFIYVPRFIEHIVKEVEELA